MGSEKAKDLGLTGNNGNEFSPTSGNSFFKDTAGATESARLAEVSVVEDEVVDNSEATTTNLPEPKSEEEEPEKLIGFAGLRQRQKEKEKGMTAQNEAPNDNSFEPEKVRSFLTRAVALKSYEERDYQNISTKANNVKYRVKSVGKELLPSFDTVSLLRSVKVTDTSHLTPKELQTIGILLSTAVTNGKGNTAQERITNGFDWLAEKMGAWQQSYGETLQNNIAKLLEEIKTAAPNSLAPSEEYVSERREISPRRAEEQEVETHQDNTYQGSPFEPNANAADTFSALQSISTAIKKHDVAKRPALAGTIITKLGELSPITSTASDRLKVIEKQLNITLGTLAHEEMRDTVATVAEAVFEAHATVDEGLKWLTDTLDHIASSDAQTRNDQIHQLNDEANQKLVSKRMASMPSVPDATPSSIKTPVYNYTLGWVLGAFSKAYTAMVNGFKAFKKCFSRRMVVEQNDKSSNSEKQVVESVVMGSAIKVPENTMDQFIREYKSEIHNVRHTQYFRNFVRQGYSVTPKKATASFKECEPKFVASTCPKGPRRSGLC